MRRTCSDIKSLYVHSTLPSSRNKFASRYGQGRVLGTQVLVGLGANVAEGITVAVSVNVAVGGITMTTVVDVGVLVAVGGVTAPGMGVLVGPAVGVPLGKTVGMTAAASGNSARKS